MPTSMFTWTSEQKSPPASNHEKILAECCEQKRTCRFQMVHNGFSASASFAVLQPNEITLLVSRSDAALLVPQAICCVSFPHNGTYCAFLSNLLDVRENNFASRKISVAVPKQLVSTNLRQSFRVPIVPEAAFEAAVSLADDQWMTVRAIDIAQTGLEVELPESDTASLSIGDIVNSEFRFHEDVVRHYCEVKRVSGRRIGLAFVVADEEEDRVKANVVSNIVISLQQVWLRNRTK